MLRTSRSIESGPTALIVEDERALRDELVDALARLWPELEVVAAVADGDAALHAISAHAPDIVFLDVRIPGPDGLEIARRMGESAHVVFVTAYDAHAVEAFEKGAADYVLKPISTERLQLTVRRLKQKLGALPADVRGLVDELRTRLQVPEVPRHLRWLTAQVGKSTRFIAIDDVVFFQSDQKYTRVVLAESEFLIKKTLKELVTELDPGQFWQTHRSTVVNALQIAAMEPDFAGRLTMRMKGRREELPVAESFARRYRQM